MDDVHHYQIQIEGQMNEEDLNLMSPLKLKIEQADETAALLTVCTDQAGLVGMLRHLHGLGFVLLAVHNVTISQK